MISQAPPDLDVRAPRPPPMAGPHVFFIFVIDKGGSRGFWLKSMRRKLVLALLLNGLCCVVPDLLARRIAHGYWPRAKVLEDRFEEMALKVMIDPCSMEIDRSRLRDLVQEELEKWYPSCAEVKEGGSYAENTSIDGVSDYDLWLYTSPMGQNHRVELFHRFQRIFTDAGLSVAERDNGIGRKAMKLRVESQSFALNVDIVPLNMIKDVGFDKHIHPKFTRCDSRRDAQETASEHVLKHRESGLAICGMKALCAWEGKLGAQSIPGYFLNHVARRSYKRHSSASALFKDMAQSLMAFCELHHLLGRPQTLENWNEVMEKFNSETWQITSRIPQGVRCECMTWLG